MTRWSQPAPFEEVVDVAHPIGKYTRDQISLYQKLSRVCARRPRLVCVELHPDVPYSPEAIVSRIWGGTVQEFQFFPETRQVLVLFIEPTHAQIFVEHVENAQRTSAHEYRRLQIAVSWHQGNERAGTVKQSKYAARLALFHGGSRVLRVDRINQRIPHDELRDIFKQLLAQQGFVFQCRLVKPKHSHQRPNLDANEVVLEC